MSLKSAAIELAMSSNTHALVKPMLNDHQQQQLFNRNNSLSNQAINQEDEYLILDGTASSTTTSSSSPSLASTTTATSNESELTFIKNLLLIEQDSEEKFQYDLEQNGFVKRLINFNHCMNQTDESKSDELRLLIVELIDSDCRHLIKWVNRMPDFAMLSIEDQTNSIELNFLEVILIEYLWRSLEFNHLEQQYNSQQQKKTPEFKFYLNENLALTRSTFIELNMLDLYERLSSLIAKLYKAQFTREEYVCMKLLALLKSDFGFMNLSNLDLIRKKCTKSLKQASFRAVTSIYGSSNNNNNDVILAAELRHDSLLMLLSDIKLISIRLSYLIFVFHSEHQTQLPNLLYDLLNQKSNIFSLYNTRHGHNLNNRQNKNDVIPGEEMIAENATSDQFKIEQIDRSLSSSSSSSSSSPDIQMTK